MASIPPVDYRARRHSIIGMEGFAKAAFARIATPGICVQRSVEPGIDRDPYTGTERPDLGIQ
jgi:hypothetical protein